jgi:hypothetical protein
MSNISRLFIIICLIFSFNEVLAQSLEEVMENTWYGASRSRSEVTESGYFYCEEKLYNVEYYDYDNSFTATLKTIFNLDGVEYESVWSVTGEVDTEDYSLVIRPDYNIISDILPDGLYWVSDNIYLQLYNDSEHEGYYIMSGQSSSMQYSDEVFELGDYPY